MDYQFDGEYGEIRPSMVGPIRHTGKDVPAPQSGYLFPPITGQVTSVDTDPLGYGINVVIQQGNRSVRLAHLQSSNVQEGDYVDPSSMVGTTGCSGVCTGPHVHYEEMRTTPFGVVYQRPPDYVEIRPPVGGGIGQGIPNPIDWFNDLAQAIAGLIGTSVDTVGDFFEFWLNLGRFLASPQFYIRLAASLVALILLIMGINSLTKATLGVGVGN